MFECFLFGTLSSVHCRHLYRFGISRFSFDMHLHFDFAPISKRLFVWLLFGRMRSHVSGPPDYQQLNGFFTTKLFSSFHLHISLCYLYRIGAMDIGSQLHTSSLPLSIIQKRRTEFNFLKYHRSDLENNLQWRSIYEFGSIRPLRRVLLRHVFKDETIKRIFVLNHVSHASERNARQMGTEQTSTLGMQR